MKKLMKKLFFVLAISTLTFSACKKGNDDGGTGNNLSASINGTTMTFNNSLVASNTSAGGAYGMQIVGFSGTPGTSDALYLVVYSSSAITPGTYVDGQSATISYNTQPAGTVYSNALSATNPISITITSISSTNVSGTFKGDIFAGASISGAKKVLTNGQFNVKF